MILFGGSNLDYENDQLYSLDLKSHLWSKINPRGDNPEHRDEHSAVLVDGKDMVIFGGFAKGVHQNSIYKYDISQNYWERIMPLNKVQP